MKALLLHRDLAFDGGVGQCFLQFARHCDGSKLELLAGGLEEAGRDLSEALGALGVRTLRFGGDPYVAPAYRLRKAIERERVDVIAATSFRAYLVAKAAALGLRCRVVFWIHSIPLVIDGALRRALFRRLARQDTLVFVSQAVRDAHAFEGHRGERRVVYNGVQDPLGVDALEPYGRERRSELGLPADALIVGCIAEFVGWKNHRVLVEAFAKLLTTHAKARLLLIGDGELRRPTLALARELGVADKVVSTGRRLDARKLLGLMDIYAHPANGEGFGLAVAEAMLAGLPTVAARAGALTELIDHRESGLLVEPDDPDALAGALAELADSPQLCSELGAAARAACLQRFSPSRYAARLTEVLLAEHEAVECAEAAVAAP